MFYLIRLDCEGPDGPSLAEFRESWHRNMTAMRGTIGPEAVRSFKIVGRKTAFALIEFPDSGALDDALTEISSLEEVEGVTELEIMPLRPYDGPDKPEPGGRGRLGEGPAGPEAPPAPPEKGSTPGGIRSLDEGADIAPERDQRRASLAGRIEEVDVPEQAAFGEPTDRREKAEPEPPENPSVTGLIRGVDSPGSPEQEGSGADEPVPAEAGEEREHASAEPEEHGPGVDGSTRSETSPTQPKGSSITGLIRGLVSPGQATDETVGSGAGDEPPGRASSGPEGQTRLGKSPGANQDSEVSAGTNRPEGSETGLIRGLDSPGRVPEASREEPAIEQPVAPSGPRVMLRVAGESGGEVLEVRQAGATMGRSPDNSIQIDDEMLSRRHAIIEFREGDFLLKDLGSSKGTFVNQTRLDTVHRLQSGDVIEFGSTRLDVAL